MKQLLTFFSATACFCLAFVSLKAQERSTPVNVSIGSLSFVQAPYVIAKERGYFHQEGIEPRFIRMQSSIASKALLTKDVHFNTLGSPTINAAISGLPVRGVFANGDRTNMYLVGAKEIHSVKDLRGKRVGIGGIADLADVGTRRFLRAKGIDPKEVTFIVLGGGSSIERLAAVMSSTVSATPLSPPQDYMAKKAGLRILGYFGETFPSFYGGVGVHMDMLRNQQSLVKGFVKASLKGLKFMHHHKSETLELMMRHMRTNDREMAGAVYDSSIRAHTKDALLGLEVQHEIIAIALEGLGKAGPVKPERVFDFSMVREAARELEQEGWKP